MSGHLLRRVARLKERLATYAQSDQSQQDKVKDAYGEVRFITLANIAILVLYGSPQIGEPLMAAWQRCLQSFAWRAFRDEYPSPLVIRGYGIEATPFSEHGARVLAEYFRCYILPTLPGDDAFQKLNQLLGRVPHWLLWFTHGDSAGILFGLKVPDPFARCRYARPSAGANHLPEEAFEWRHLPDGVEDELLSVVRERERKHRASSEALTPRQRLRLEKSRRMANAPTTSHENKLRESFNRLASSPLSPQFNILDIDYSSLPRRDIRRRR